MCGIAGILELSPRHDDASARVRDMARTIAHRGPDDEGFFDEGPVHFGFRRLSILDLSPAGHQPMSTQDGRLTIIFNGEVYNYLEIADELRAHGVIFRSKSDTEVILKAYEHWGAGCVKKFNGMWAIAIWDRQAQSLFCSRDRFGVKPFYYTIANGQFIFGSEIKALCTHPAVPRQPNLDRIYDYLVYGYQDHTPETFFQEIRQIPPAHSLLIQPGGTPALHRYWDLDPNQPAPHLSDDEFADHFLDIFRDSIRLRLRSDVPVGTCLSGGLDSSAIVCLVNELLRQEHPLNLGDRQKTFTSAYKEKEVDESEFARAVIEKTGASSNFVTPSAEDVLRDMQSIVYHQDEPFGSTSIFAQWYVMKRAHEAGVTVMLDGQGADELLAGYHPYFGPYLASLIQAQHFRKAWQEIRLWKKHHGYPASYFMYNVAAGALSKLLPRPIIHALVRLTQQNGSAFLPPAFIRQHESGQPVVRKYRDPLQNELHRVLLIGLPALLHYEDRDSMAWSIEARVPFLDYRLVEFMFAAPNEQKIDHGTTKVVLRRALKGLLPEKIETRHSKLGFATPESRWFHGPFRAMSADILQSKSFRQRQIIDADLAWDRYNRFLAGRPQTGIGTSTIWRWINLEMWFRTFID